jgi:hypothetical protein
MRNVYWIISALSKKVGRYIVFTLYIRPSQNIMQQSQILCCKYGLVWCTETAFFSRSHIFNAAILENIQWAISPEQ